VSIFGRRYKLVSPLSPQEICARFKETVGWPVFSDRTIVGYYDHRGFQLRVNKWYNDPFQIILYGRMGWNVGQTEMSCTGGFRRLVVLLYVCIFLVIMGFAYTAVFSSIVEILASHIVLERLAQVMLALVLLATGMGSVLVAKTFASDDERQLIEFLAETIDAELV